MNAIDLLTDDHDTVRDLFAKFRSAKEADDSAEMRTLQQQIFEEIETHSRIEEDVFYPAARDAGDDELTEMVAEGVQEHHVVKVLMREVEALSDEEVFVAKMTVLMENVEHHAEEEENELFPKVRTALSEERLDQLGAELEAAKAG